jgi:hypothetical protein
MLRPILGAFQLEGEIFSLDIPSHRTSGEIYRKSAGTQTNLAVRETFTALREELEAHMMREELILFPAIAELEAAAGEMVPFC